MNIRTSSSKRWASKNATLGKFRPVMASIALLLGTVPALMSTPGALASETQPACSDSFHFVYEGHGECQLVANGSPLLIAGSVTAPAFGRSDLIPVTLQDAHVSVFLQAPAPFYTVASCSREGAVAAKCWSSGAAVPAGTILKCSTWVWATRTLAPASGVASLACSNAGAEGGGEVINEPPNASFTVSCSGRECTFDGSGSSDPDGEIASHSWAFGDGASAAGSVVTHTFPATAGTYTVTLTATDNDGATDTEKKTVTCSKHGQRIRCS